MYKINRILQSKSFTFVHLCLYNHKIYQIVHSYRPKMNKSTSDNRKAWTEDEDHAIRTLVKKHGTHHWSQISKRMLDHFGPPGRSGKQCRQRWHNYLNPKINREPWSTEEEQKLFEAHEKYGNKWKEISRHLDGRTDNDIKNKFYSSMRKKLRKINKCAGVKNSTSQVKEFKPKILSNILASIEAEQPRLMKFLMSFDESSHKQAEEEEKMLGKELIAKINKLNKQYINGKDKKIETNGEIQMRQTRSKHSEVQKPNMVKIESDLIETKKQTKSSKRIQSRKFIKEEENHQNLFDGLNKEIEQEFNFDFEAGNMNNAPTPGIMTRKASKLEEQNGYFNQRFYMSSPNVRFSTPLGPSPSPGWGGPEFQPKIGDFTKYKLDDMVEQTRRRIKNKW